MDRLALARGVALLVLLWSYRLGRWLLAWLVLGQTLGVAIATWVMLLITAARWHWAIRLAALVGLVVQWHWPWWVALPCALPRALLVLPGLVRTGMARRRHPRP